MAVRGNDIRIWLDRWILSGQTNAVEIRASVPALDETVHESQAAEYIPGLPEGSVAHSGYMRVPTGSGDLEEEIYNRLGTSGAFYVAVALAVSQDPCPVYVTRQTWSNQMRIDGPVRSLITVEAEWPADDGLRRGLRVWEVSGAGVGAGPTVDMGAGATSGDLFLFVRNVSGAGTPTVDLETSPDQATWTQAASVNVAGPGGYHVDLSGTLDRYVRLNVTGLGGASALDLAGVVCYDGVTQ